MRSIGFDADVFELHELRGLTGILRMVHDLGEEQPRKILVGRERGGGDLAPLATGLDAGTHQQRPVERQRAGIRACLGSDVAEDIARI